MAVGNPSLTCTHIFVPSGTLIGRLGWWHPTRIRQCRLHRHCLRSQCLRSQFPRSQSLRRHFQPLLLKRRKPIAVLKPWRACPRKWPIDAKLTQLGTPTRSGEIPSRIQPFASLVFQSQTNPRIWENPILSTASPIGHSADRIACFMRNRVPFMLWQVPMWIGS